MMRPAACPGPRRPATAVALAILALALALALAVLETDARADSDGRRLGQLEQESLEEARAGLGLTLDPNPQGKTIGKIHIVNQEVFSRRDWWFQWFNLFHRTTRPNVLQRELLMTPGQPYNEALVEESMRNLQAPRPLTIAGRTLSPPELSSVVVIVPVASARPDQVDLLVVTRDVWSLRFNTAFEFQQNTLASLSTSLSENNLFGWRKFLSFNLLMDQGRVGGGPTYVDPNIKGTHLTLYVAALAWYARSSERYEGNNETFSLRYPLYSLATRWGGGVDVTHQDTVIRSFRGNSLRQLQVVLPAGGSATTPYIYRRKITIVDTNVMRSFGDSVIQRLTAGYLIDGRRSDVLPDVTDPVAAQPFLDQYAPVSEQRSEPYLRYDLFTPRYVVFRDLDTFDLRENRLLGPSLTLSIAYGLPALGADFRAFVFGGSASWAEAPGGGYARAHLGASARLREGQLIDQTVSGSVYLATPILARVMRLVVAGEADTVRADTQRAFFFVGGATGLRGYAIGDFQGTSRAVGHAELRSEPVAIFSQRFGGLLFYDVGHAAPSLEEIVPHHDFGVGLRWLIPQLNSSVLRLDWAFATQATAFTRAGWPGRFTAGYEQVF